MFMIYFYKNGEKKMKKNRLIIGLCAIAVLLISLTVTLLDVFVPFNLWVHPVLNYFCFAFIGFGLMTFVMGVKRESPWFLFISSFLLGISVFYAMVNYILWWVALLICGVIVAIVGILCFILFGSKTEDIALNKSKDYKNYKERKKENEKTEEKTELPEIKSFK